MADRLRHRPSTRFPHFGAYAVKVGEGLRERIGNARGAVGGQVLTITPASASAALIADLKRRYGDLRLR